MAGKNLGHEAWERARLLADGLQIDPTLDLSSKGRWTEDKLHKLCQYLAIFCNGMHGNPHFADGLCFIDLFAGSGLCTYESSTGNIHPLPGSTLIAASFRPKSFAKIVACDIEEKKLALLKTRVEQCGFAGTLDLTVGDVNAEYTLIKKKISDKFLNIAFIDPYSLSIHYNTIKYLTSYCKMDLMILFTLRTDLLRNVRDLYYPSKNDKLDQFLGNDSGWRQKYQQHGFPRGESCIQLFISIYVKQLQKLGYAHSDIVSIPQQSPLFSLVYASKSSLGLKFFNIARSRDSDGQLSLFE